METRTKHYLQKFVVHKLLGKRFYSKIKFLKIYLKAKLGSNYEISNILLNVLKNDDVFFDVGANIGQYIIRIKNRFKEGVFIYAFEPVLSNYNILSNYVSKKCQNVILENVAVSDIEGTDIIYIPLIEGIEIDTQASIDYENRMNYYNDFAKQEVQIITIDNYVKSNGIKKIDYLKIDTEGNDEKVFKGALESIIKFKPVIFCEDIESTEITNKLYSLGYNRFLLNKEYKLVYFKDDKPNNVFNDLFIFIPEDKINIFKEYILNIIQ